MNSVGRTLRECSRARADLRLVAIVTAPGRSRRSPAQPRIAVLDIQIDSLTGCNWRAHWDPQTLPLIVFVHRVRQHALEAFEVSAVDYLLKPFDDDRFRRTLARVRQRREARAPRAGIARWNRFGADRAQCGCDRARRGSSRSSGAACTCWTPAGGSGRGDRNYVKLIVGREVF